MLKEGHLAGEGKGSGIPSSGELSNGGKSPHSFHSPGRLARPLAGSHIAPPVFSFFTSSV